MSKGAKFEIFKSLGVNYYAFHLRKNKIYDYCSVGICSILIGTTVFIGVTFIYNWRESMMLLRYHHAKLEVERAKYIEIIRQARQDKLIPPRGTL